MLAAPAGIAGKVAMGGSAGMVGNTGEPILFFGPVTPFSKYVVPGGWVTVSATMPAVTTTFPFTSIRPVRFALEPTDKMVPGSPPELAAVIFPLTIAPLASVTFPRLLMFADTVTPLVDFTRT